MNTKKEVLYKQDKNNKIIVGHKAYVLPINHPNCTNHGHLAQTSKVLSHDPKTGSFETENSHYILMKSL